MDRPDFDPTTTHVVTEGVVDQVGHQPLDKPWVTGDERRCQLRLHAHAAALSLFYLGGEHPCWAYARQVEALLVVEAPLAAPPGCERASIGTRSWRSQAPRARAVLASQGLDRGVWVVQGDFYEGSLEGDPGCAAVGGGVRHRNWRQ